MNASLIVLELAVVCLGLILLVQDLYTPAKERRTLGYGAVLGVAVILLYSFFAFDGNETLYAFGNAYVLDGLALWFKRFFLLAALLVLIMAAEYSDRFEAGQSEFFALILFALAGMMFAASANDFTLLFVSLELITVTFYVLVSFLRRRVESLEAGVKYLILGALSSGFLVYGIALVFGVSGTLNFNELADKLTNHPALGHKSLLFTGLLLVFVGLGFKMAIVPFQIWAPDVYQGSPTPTTAFLSVGSKAAGVVLLMRLLGTAIPDLAFKLEKLLMTMAGLSILYGSLCAVPQRNLKRLLGYSSIASAGYLLLGFAVMNKAGSSAVLYYLAGYLFTALAAFSVIAIVVREAGAEDIDSLAGLAHRSPLLAATLTLAMVSLAGIPPLAGFFGKFLLLKAVVAEGIRWSAYYWLFAVAVAGVLVSLYYYFNVVRAIYWSKNVTDLTPISLSLPTKFALAICIIGMLWLGLYPGGALELAVEAVKSLKLV
ncbi:MAG: NADH-quinone oxidoreductase subunit N [Verrucomicrobia bacterium]|nr:NADH-quinone oxidoreductase subunit N [Verrucomicrobiota bacterium]